MMKKIFYMSCEKIKLLTAFLGTVLLFNNFVGCSITAPACCEKTNGDGVYDLLLQSECKGLENTECVSMIAKSILQESASKYENARYYEAVSAVNNTTVSTWKDILFFKSTQFSKFNLSYSSTKEKDSKIDVHGIKYKRVMSNFVSLSLLSWIESIRSEDYNKEFPVDLGCDEKRLTKDDDLDFSTKSTNIFVLGAKTSQSTPLMNLIASNLKLSSYLSDLTQFRLKGQINCKTEKCYVISSVLPDEKALDLYEFWIGKDSFLIHKVIRIQILENKTIGYDEEAHENIVLK
jgi:hypothetical protein